LVPQLGVNIDHIATIREARKTIEPDPVLAAAEAELGGAACITFHLRKDRRHINDRDAGRLKETVSVKLNMEMSMDEEIVSIALELKPQQVTLVPENRAEITTEGGLDCISNIERLKEVVGRFRDMGVIVSAFIDPVEQQIHAAAGAGCPAMEIHTGAYAEAYLAPGADPEKEAQNIEQGLKAGLDAGLEVHAGHGLTYDNVSRIAGIEGFSEFNIGHSIVSRAAFVGMRRAVKEMRKLVAT
jgi:pyridoxine 5-phosphate synthase